MLLAQCANSLPLLIPATDQVNVTSCVQGEGPSPESEELEREKAAHQQQNTHHARQHKIIAVTRTVK